MADFSVITPQLATGAAIQSSADVVALQDAGVTHVVDCRAEFDDAPLLAGAGLIYLWDPTQDDGQPKPDEWWRKGLDFAEAAYRGPARAMVYCHCAAGVNRGPSMAYGVLRSSFDYEPAEAESAIRAVRPQVGLAYKADFERYWSKH